jgi:hypothetical protein
MARTIAPTPISTFLWVSFNFISCCEAANVIYPAKLGEYIRAEPIHLVVEMPASSLRLGSQAQVP